MGWLGFVWVELLGCRVAGGRDVWLSEVGVGVGLEVWRRLGCLLCCIVGRVLCIAAYVRPAREHDSLVFMYFVLFWCVSCFVCVILCTAGMRTREVRGAGGVRRVCRVMCDRSV